MKNVMNVLMEANIIYDDSFVKYGMVFVSDIDNEAIINQLLHEAGIKNYYARPVDALHPFLDNRLVIEEKDW